MREVLLGPGLSRCICGKTFPNPPGAQALILDFGHQELRLILDSGIWHSAMRHLESGIWNLSQGSGFCIWHLESGISDLASGIWNLESGIWTLEEVTMTVILNRLLQTSGCREAVFCRSTHSWFEINGTTAAMHGLLNIRNDVRPCSTGYECTA